jgi:hypothetical protein
MYHRELKSTQLGNQLHEITDAITAVIINTQAGLHLLCAQSPDLEELRQVLNRIASSGKRAGGITVRARELETLEDPEANWSRQFQDLGLNPDLNLSLR